MGGLYVCAGGIDIPKFDKNSIIYSVSYFKLGSWSFVWGFSLPKPPRGDVTVCTAG